MTTRFQVTIDCADPQLMTLFWAAALGYVVEPPPEGLDTWNAYWGSLGVSDDEVGNEFCIR